MRSGGHWLLALCGAVLLAAPALGQSEIAAKPRLIVLTDIGNEPDDSMSLVRLLAYANEFEIEGLVATTSTHLRDRTHREMIERRVRVYGEVLPNLRVHAAGWPDEAHLASRIRSGCAAYGMACVGKGKDTEASRLIVAAVDRPDPRPVWVAIWGGGADLAQALWSVQTSRSPREAERFVAKLRVYSISDQDDAEPWARAMFPKLFWITSVHAFNEYLLATWIGITAPAPGVDQTQVSQPWLDAHIRSRGPLGALYPKIVFGMEGDTPSFLYLIPNGLGSSEHPDWGSWGGRYGQPSKDWGLWASSADRYTGSGGVSVTSNAATISRWRSAFQNDFAARMAWTVETRFSGANHPPQQRLNGVAGQEPVEIAACAGEAVRLSAQGSTDPDGQALSYRWWHYREASAQMLAVKLEGAETAEATAVVQPWVHASSAAPLPSYPLHVILEVTDSGTPALTRYRRAIINVQTGGTSAGRPCPPPILRRQAAYTDEAAPPAGAPSVLSTANSSLGELLDNPAARAVLARHIPELVRGGEVEQARSMTLRVLQFYMPGLNETKLDAIDTDLQAIPAR
jgi:Protein of unknown function (DUF1593)